MIDTPCESKSHAKAKFERIIKKCHEEKMDYEYDDANLKLRVVLVPRSKIKKCDAIYEFNAEEEIMSLDIDVCGSVANFDVIGRIESAINDL